MPYQSVISYSYFGGVSCLRSSPMEDGGSKLLWNINTTITNLHNVIYEKTSVSINEV